MSHVKTQHGSLPKTFKKLCVMYPPHAISDSADYNNTVEIVDRLALLDRRTKGQEQYLETLTQLIEAYDNANVQIPSSNPVDVIRYLMDAHVLSASEIGRILGSRSLGPAILRGDRQISKANAIALAEHFKLNPGLFIAA
jgi:HTH-type transcriptional regulator/antitoxin HigA